VERKNDLASQSHNRALLRKRIVLGIGTALILMILLLIQVDEPNPEWGELWMVRPLIMVSFGGAACGAFYHLMEQFAARRNWNTIMIKVFSLIVCMIMLWMSFILGLDGTLWD
jgi:hypothetical protein